MGKAIFTNGNFIFGESGLGRHGDGIGSVKQVTHDGDTVNVRLLDNLAIRFLGIDTPETSFDLPEPAGETNKLNFVSIGDNRWEAFLSDPLSATWKTFSPPLDQELQAHLSAVTGPGVAKSHHKHAKAAEDALEKLIQEDFNNRGLSDEDGRFFMAFANDVMDGFGRLLCYLNIQEPNAEQRPLTYNERLLALGMAVPYFIWPNIDPFRRETSLANAALSPLSFRQRIAESPTLNSSRAAVKQARQDEKGIFNPTDPLKLLPFELRFLARRRPPSRWVINLAAEDNRIHVPQRYVGIPNVEDRLFIPEEYVPLFISKGWQSSTIQGPC